MKQPKSIAENVDSLLQKLSTTFTAAVAGLESERESLEEEDQRLETAANQFRRLLPAKAREAERAADALELAGKSKEAQAKREEQQRAERAPHEMEQRRRVIGERLTAIDGANSDTARRVFETWFPELREALIAEQRELCKALDSAWSGIQQFAIETGNQDGRNALAAQRILSDLTAREHGQERALFEKLLQWFGGA